MPNSSNGSEPSLALSNDGIRYVSWQSPGKFAGSADGVNFSALATPDTGASGDVTNAVSYSGALYNGQICGGGTILHSCIYRSLDGGGHWSTQNTLADMNAGASDRPWIDVYPRKNATPTASNPDKDTVYLEYHTFSRRFRLRHGLERRRENFFAAPHHLERHQRVQTGCNGTVAAVHNPGPPRARAQVSRPAAGR